MCLHCNNKAHHNTQADTFRLMPITSLKQLVLAYTFQVDAAGNGTQAEDLDMRASLISTEKYTCWEFSIFSIFYFIFIFIFIFIFCSAGEGFGVLGLLQAGSRSGHLGLFKILSPFPLSFSGHTQESKCLFFINITYVACTLDHDR